MSSPSVREARGRGWVRWVALAAACAEPAPEADDPGQVTWRRLNRAEYDNTVRDLFETEQRPARAFPADDFGYGFSNIGDVLSVSPLHLELYQGAAEALLAEIASDRVAPVQTVSLPADAATGLPAVLGQVVVWGAGAARWSFTADAAGSWSIAADWTPTHGAALAVAIDDQPPTPLADAARWTLAAGPHTLTLTVLPGDPAASDPPSATVRSLTLAGPWDAALPPGPGRARIFTCTPEAIGEPACAEQIVRDFGRRAWRRPLRAAEHATLLGVYGEARAAGADWEEGVLWSLNAILMSPHFLYRVEPQALSGVAPLDDWALATRLSYFLWSSTPDDALLDLADAGRLRDPDVLAGEVRRMLADPKASALVETLGVEWLYVDAVQDAAPAPEAFPDFDEGLRTSMREEMSRFVGSVLLGGRPMSDLVNGRDTFVDARLAAHYGVSAPSVGFAPIHLPDRPGLLGRAGWLTALSYPSRTSPVRRGDWVLGHLRCEAPPPPPPGIPALPTDDTGAPDSLRDQMEQHRSDPSCASCHTVMDGIGFGLEHFDGVGAWRDRDPTGAAIDARGTLTDGSAFDGAAALGDLLAADPTVSRCMAQQVFTFALGRPPGVADLDDLDAIHAAFVDGGLQFEALATAIVRSYPFRYQGGAP